MTRVTHFWEIRSGLWCPGDDEEAQVVTPADSHDLGNFIERDTFVCSEEDDGESAGTFWIVDSQFWVTNDFAKEFFEFVIVLNDLVVEEDLDGRLIVVFGGDMAHGNDEFIGVIKLCVFYNGRIDHDSQSMDMGCAEKEENEIDEKEVKDWDDKETESGEDRKSRFEHTLRLKVIVKRDDEIFDVLFHVWAFGFSLGAVVDALFLGRDDEFREEGVMSSAMTRK